MLNDLHWAYPLKTGHNETSSQDWGHASHLLLVSVLLCTRQQIKQSTNFTLFHSQSNPIKELVKFYHHGCLRE